MMMTTEIHVHIEEEQKEDDDGNEHNQQAVDAAEEDSFDSVSFTGNIIAYINNNNI